MSVYSDLILAHASLRVYYRLGESSGTTADDAGPNSLDLTYAASGVTYGVSGAVVNDADTAVTFDGTADGPGRVDADPLDLGDGPLSLELWLKRSAAQGAAQFLIGKGSPAYGLLFGGGNTVVFQKIGTANVVASTVAITDTTTWHHIVVTKAAGGGTSATKLYIDGIDRTGTVTDQTLGDGTGALRVGGASTTRFPGSLDEVAIYGAVLTPAEVAEHYEVGRGIVSAPAAITLSVVVPAVGIALAPPASDVTVAAPAPIPALSVAAPAIAVTVEAVAPAVSVTDGVAPPAAEISVEAVAPAVGVSVQAPSVEVTLAALAPNPALSLTPPATEIQVEPLAPAITADRTVQAPTATVDVAALAPAVVTPTQRGSSVYEPIIRWPEQQRDARVRAPYMTVTIGALSPSVDTESTWAEEYLALVALVA